MLIADSHPTLNERNKILCEFIPYAHRQIISLECALGLADRDASRFGTAYAPTLLHQHMREAESLWAGCENTFMQRTQ